MHTISLTVRLPEGISPDQVADIAFVIADAAQRCKDWNDQSDWDIVQTDGSTVIVTAPDPRRRYTGAITSASKA